MKKRKIVFRIIDIVLSVVLCICTAFLYQNFIFNIVNAVFLCLVSIYNLTVTYLMAWGKISPFPRLIFLQMICCILGIAYAGGYIIASPIPLRFYVVCGGVSILLALLSKGKFIRDNLFEIAIIAFIAYGTIHGLLFQTSYAYSRNNTEVIYATVNDLSLFEGKTTSAYITLGTEEGELELPLKVSDYHDNKYPEGNKIELYHSVGFFGVEYWSIYH